MATISLVPTIEGTIFGNSEEGTAFGSIVEAQLKSILSNPQMTVFLKNTMTSRSNGAIPQGVSEAIFRIARRVVVGRTYETTTGAPEQTGSMDTASIKINREINFKFTAETYDMQQFLNGGAMNLRGSLLATWLSSATINALDNLEAYLINGIKSYAYAYAATNTGIYATIPSTLVLANIGGQDTWQNTTKEAAVAALKTIKTINTKMTLSFTNYQRGVDPTHVINVLSRWTRLSLQVYYETAYGGSGAGAPTFAVTREGWSWASETIYGLPFTVSNFLEKDFPMVTYGKFSEPGGGLNLDDAFDFTNMLGVTFHNDVWAMPINFKSMTYLLNPDTANPRWIMKTNFSSPTALREGLTTVYLKVAPTSTEITDAIATMYTHVADPKLASFAIGEYLQQPTTAPADPVDPGTTEANTKKALGDLLTPEGKEALCEAKA